MKRLWQCHAILLLGLLSVFGLAWGQALELTDEEQAFVSSHPTIRVANDKHYAPFDFYENGKPQGYSVELIELLLTKMGFKVEFVSHDEWNDSIRDIQAGRIDVLTSVQLTETDSQYLLFSNPYLRAREVILKRSGDQSIHSANDLQGKIVAMPRGYDYLNVLRNRDVDFQHLVVANMQEAVDAVARGKADATMEAELVLQHIITTQGYTDLEMVYRVFGQEYENFYNCHFGVQHDLPILRALINKALIGLSMEERNRLYLKWFGKSLGLEVDPAQTAWQLTPDEQDFVRSKSALSVCVLPNWSPLTSMSPAGVHEGVLIDLLGLLNGNLKLPLVFRGAANEHQAKQLLGAGQCDLAVLPQGQTESADQLTWTKPLLSLPYVLAARSGQLFVSSLKEVEDQSFAVIRDEALLMRLRLLYPHLDMRLVDSADEGIELLRSGEVFGYIDTSLAVASAIQKAMVGNVKIVGKAPYDLNVALAAKRDDVLLHAVMQKSIDAVPDAAQRGVMNQWMSVRSEIGIDYSLVWRIGLGAAVLLALTLAWSLTIHASRKRTQYALAQLHHAQGQLEKQNQQLARVSVTDHLTGVFNRVRLDQVLADSLSEAVRSGKEFAVIILDLDYFKRVNDTFGHQGGDRVLVAVVNLLSQCIRKADVLGRWGGEEFMIICPDGDLAGATHLAQKLRHAIEQYEFPEAGRVTASLGVSAYQPGDTVNVLVGRADGALYLAKNNGRNRVESSPG
ncbi:transporter substrate-binding domain-containing protein [Pseudomonas sp. MAP12]|uniref:diguanylate cyclase n=1 Tax=Geopseudomonas aromaticivorans TaxID=2849492 RepID=A0ABS6MSC6_9GAMM|nr:transporter substrate-binding domain-containing protein [Pseudomonas aromaticivorans]MBV2131703.1 transporter substrate-binding domain-containing protein [Pseudomonas aromaticivorans]